MVHLTTEQLHQGEREGDDWAREETGCDGNGVGEMNLSFKLDLGFSVWIEHPMLEEDTFGGSRTTVEKYRASRKIF